MSVYIKGMEMPKDGNETIIRIQPDGTVLDQYGHHLAITAVPVPPHWDLIDKKTVSENLASVLNKKNQPFSYPDWNDAIVAMLTAPTIIPSSGGIEDE